MDKINLENCKILYSCGLKIGNDHYIEDSETLIDIVNCEQFDSYPFDKKHIILTGDIIICGGGNYKRSEVNFLELFNKYKKLFIEYKDETKAKEKLLEDYIISPLNCKSKYNNRYLLKNK